MYAFNASETSSCINCQLNDEQSILINARVYARAALHEAWVLSVLRIKLPCSYLLGAKGSALGKLVVRPGGELPGVR